MRWGVPVLSDTRRRGLRVKNGKGTTAMARKLWIASGMVLFGLTVTWLALRLSETAGDEPAEQRSFGQGEPRLVVGPLTEISDAKHDSRTLSNSSAESSSPQAQGRTVISGSIVFVDADGSQRPSDRGSVTWEVRGPGNTIVERRVVIVDGRWRFEVDDQSSVKPVGALWSDDRNEQHAQVDGTLMSLIEANGANIRATLQYGCTLRVVDTATWRDVDNVELVLQEAGYPTGTRYPPAQAVGRSAVHPHSPVRLPHRPGIIAGWCRAPGYAWRRFAFTGDSSVHTIPLSQGSELTVEVRNLPVEATQPAVYLVDADESASADLALKFPVAKQSLTNGGRVTFSGLPPGRIAIVVTSGGLKAAGPRLAERVVDLPLGANSTQIIDIGGASAELGALEIAVELDASARASSMTRLAIQRVGFEREAPVEHMLREKLDANARASVRLSELSPGEYIVWLVPQGVISSARVQSGAVTALALKERPGVPIEVHVSRADRGSAISEATVRLGPALIRDSAAYAELPESAGKGRYAGRCSAGEHALIVHYPGFAVHSQNVTLDAAPVQVEVALRALRAYTVRAHAIHGTEDLVLPEEFWTSVRVIDPNTGRAPAGVERRLIARQIGGFTNFDTALVDFTFQRPGTYTLELPKFSGFQRPETITITVLTEGLHELPIQLEYQ